MTINRKAILLSGGKGTRLYPSTMAISKHLIPIYDKPLIYYPLSLIMLTGIKDILLITTERDINSYKNLLGNGSQWGIDIEYKIQENPNGIADALLLAEDYLDGAPSLLLLGDNIFYGNNLQNKLKKINEIKNGAYILSYYVQDPNRYGVIEYDNNDKIKSIEEKPIKAKSNYALTGIYFFDKFATKYAKTLQFSSRQELEIVDLIRIYLQKNKLFGEKLGRGFAWLDTGTCESLLDAQLFIQTIEKRQGLKIGCPEEIAFNNKWISKTNLKKLIKIMGKNCYSSHLKNLIK